MCTNGAVLPPDRIGSGGRWAHASEPERVLFRRMRAWVKWHTNETFTRGEDDNRYALVCQPAQLYEFYAPGGACGGRPTAPTAMVHGRVRRRLDVSRVGKRVYITPLASPPWLRPDHGRDFHCPSRVAPSPGTVL